MAKSRRVKAVEAQKSSGKKPVRKLAPSQNLAGKVLKTKKAKLPIEKVVKKEAPKNSKTKKEPVKKIGETKSSTKKVVSNGDELAKKQSTKMTEVRLQKYFTPFLLI